MQEKISNWLNRDREESVGNDDASIVAPASTRWLGCKKTENPEGTG